MLNLHKINSTQQYNYLYLINAEPNRLPFTKTPFEINFSITLLEVEVNFINFVPANLPLGLKSISVAIRYPLKLYL